MNDQIRHLVKQIQDLETELASILHEQETRMLYHISGKRVRFEQAVKHTHRRLKIGIFRWLKNSRPLNILSVPLIYCLIIPIFLLDVSLCIYQAICFRLYHIPAVKRGDYMVIDRHQLAYLNIIEKLNCMYCSYVNGLFAYARELASLTEQYWCPIKHANRIIDPHQRYLAFTEYGKAESYHESQLVIQRALATASEKSNHD